MGKRAHGDGLPPERQETRAHAHNERHRIRGELSRIREEIDAGVEPDDVVEPGREWVAPHHREHRPAPGRAPVRHWKQKFWKRRSVERRRRADQANHED
jgi:hypothetical protein